MPLVVKNVQHGMTTPGGTFIPFRGSSDYDPARAGEPERWRSKWSYEDKPRKRKAASRKTTAKKAARKTAARKTAARRAGVAVPARSPGSGLRAYALAASRARGGRRGVPLSRNPEPYYLVVLGTGNTPGGISRFNTLAAAMKHAKALYTRGLAFGRVVEIWKWHGKNNMESSLVYSKDYRDDLRRRNPIPIDQWTPAKVRRTRSGDVKIMLSGKPKAGRGL